MATEMQRIEDTLKEWRLDRDWQTRILNDPKAPKDAKDFAKKRIKLADEWIGRILKDYPALK